MLAPNFQLFAESERAYRQEQIAAEFHPGHRRLRLKWPAGLLSPNRRHPRTPRAVLPAPHHATSIG
jgi:hypothetical protein